LDNKPFQGYQPGIRRKDAKDATEMHKRSSPSITLTKRVHLIEQTALPRGESSRITTRTHVPASKRKVVPGRHHLGSVEPGRLPSYQIFGGRIVFIFSKAVANIFILRDGRNRPLKL
jgi:hypothetical protein